MSDEEDSNKIEIANVAALATPSQTGYRVMVAIVLSPMLTPQGKVDTLNAIIDTCKARLIEDADIRKHYDDLH